jgi:hypothetical protein
MRFLSRTPVRTFLIYPLVVLLWALLSQGGRIEVNPWGLPLMIWGYLQYRSIRGGGGPGPEVPAYHCQLASEHLVVLPLVVSRLALSGLSSSHPDIITLPLTPDRFTLLLQCVKTHLTTLGELSY